MLVLLLATSACTSASVADRGDNGAELLEPRVWSPAIDEYPSEFDDIPTEILSDGIVTPAELEQAILASFACMQAHGIEFTPEIKYGASGWIVAVEFTARADSPEAVDEASRIAAECETRLTEPVWDIVRTQSPERERSELIADVIACMEDRGITVGADAAAGDPSALLMLAPEEFDYCWYASQ